MEYQVLSDKKQALDKLLPIEKETKSNLDNWFISEFTYNSNAIDGNSLTRSETKLVIEKGLTVSGKTINEHIEILNFSRSYNYILELSQKANFQITEQDLLKIHELMLNLIEIKNAGKFRDVSIKIKGVEIAGPGQIPELIREYLDWFNNENTLHAIDFASEAHLRLLKIQPFLYGNGRLARLILNLALLKKGYPPVIIRKKDKEKYLTAIERAKTSNKPFTKLIQSASLRSLNSYLKAAKNKDFYIEDEDNLLKIGELAKLSKTSIPTIRHWTEYGLLETSKITDAGYNLYADSMLDKVIEIKNLKAKGLSLKEITREAS